MKKLLSITFLTIVLLASVLLNLSCNGTSQNNTVRSNAVNGNAAPSNTDQSIETFAAVDCSGDAVAKKNKINIEVKKEINGEKNLRYQHNQNTKNFDFELVVDANNNNVATLYIWGFIFTDSNNRNLLSKTFKNVFKKQCVEKVVFTSPPSPSPSPDKLTSAARFEFTLCEHPNQICSDGTCQQDCDRWRGNSNTNMNSNSNK